MKFYSILEGSTQDVLRRFLRLINKSIARIGTVEADVEALEDELKLKATKEALDALEARVEALENPTTEGETTEETTS